MIEIPLTNDQYQAALKHLMDLRPPDVETVVLPSPDGPGLLVTPQISLTFGYDASQDRLNVNITAKHGLAKFASEDTIKSHLLDILSQA